MHVWLCGGFHCVTLTFGKMCFRHLFFRFKVKMRRAWLILTQSIKNRLLELGGQESGLLS